MTYIILNKFGIRGLDGIKCIRPWWDGVKDILLPEDHYSYHIKLAKVMLCCGCVRSFRTSKMLKHHSQTWKKFEYFRGWICWLLKFPQTNVYQFLQNNQNHCMSWEKHLMFKILVSQYMSLLFKIRANNLLRSKNFHNSQIFPQTLSAPLSISWGWEQIILHWGGTKHLM